ncbi:hypothetical protein O6H91_02G082700 [Diphasiastrum complanatum]|uniref:Uncharacterized protein n=5 Tax=Diphasiastrum complanatum TaxID=34168 RepID=A0ACC2EHS1_DIPCM|nr:hypothetical protein O6H91_02G082700 [Diphasiastrum complanatum]KAJ7565956.1 hypothetical protein O6H91_02G082700 [Diphasiastrum complanatum]
MWVASSASSTARVPVAALLRHSIYPSFSNPSRIAFISIKAAIGQLDMAREASGIRQESFPLTGFSSPQSQGLLHRNLPRPIKGLKRMLVGIYSLLLVFVMLFQSQISRSVATTAEHGANQRKDQRRSQKRSSQLPLLPQLGTLRLWMHEQNDGLVRRELAKQGESGRSLEEPETVWSTHAFVNTRQQTIFTQSWIPVSGKKIKGLVVLLHGLNEYSGRYARFARQLNAAGYGVFGMDWIGHGGTDGLHGYVESLDYAVSDTTEFLQKVASQHPSVPCFLFGHSTGGAIAVKVAIQSSAKKLLNGLVLTSPALRIKPGHPVLRAVAPLFSILLPKYQFRGNRKRQPVCRDPAALAAKYSDPLVYTGPIRIRTATEILRITSYLQRNLSKVSIPFFVLHGTEDKVTDPTASQDLYDQAVSEIKNAKFYDGLLHDLLFELEKDSIAADIIDWLDRMIEVA